MTIGFLVGPALGHFGRCLMIAEALCESDSSVGIVFFSPDRNGYLQRLVAPCGYRTVYLEGNPYRQSFAEELESALSRESLDALVLDLSPIPWLLFARLPRIPQIYVTNYFVTHLGSQTTVQDQKFARMRFLWNWIRRRRGLEPLEGARQLYERDLVLLADPPRLLPTTISLPPNFKCVGPLSWEPASDLPEALSDVQDVLFVSLGSTGRPPPAAMIEGLSDASDSSRVVLVGEHLKEPLSGSSWANYHYLPGSEMVKRAKLVVTQGGAGSTYQALGHGVPVCCWPTHLNHRVLASRLEELSVGVLLEPRTWRTKVDDLRANFQRLCLAARPFKDGGFKEAANQAARHIRSV